MDETRGRRVERQRDYKLVGHENESQTWRPRGLLKKQNLGNIENRTGSLAEKQSWSFEIFSTVEFRPLSRTTFRAIWNADLFSVFGSYVSKINKI